MLPRPRQASGSPGHCRLRGQLGPGASAIAEPLRPTGDEPGSRRTLPPYNRGASRRARKARRCLTGWVHTPYGPEPTDRQLRAAPLARVRALCGDAGRRGAADCGDSAPVGQVIDGLVAGSVHGAAVWRQVLTMSFHNGQERSLQARRHFGARADLRIAGVPVGEDSAETARGTSSWLASFSFAMSGPWLRARSTTRLGR